MASDTGMTKYEAIEKAEGRGRALARLKAKVSTSAKRMTGAGLAIAGGFVGGVVRGKDPQGKYAFGGFHVNQIGGGLAVAVGLAGVIDDDLSDLIADFGAGTLAFELGREAEKRILTP
jgi:hypothetical protein